MIALCLLALTLTVPPAAKVIAVSVVVYAVIQALKRVPALTPYLTGWVAVILNAAFSALGVVIVTPADQLYSQGTLNAILQAVVGVLSASGIHGMTKSLGGPKDPPAQAPPAQKVG